jgi:2-dehydropantoate 2-reductase
MAPRILVFGAGSIGATYGYILSKAVSPSNIVAVCRSNYAAASAHGFTIHSTLWGRDLSFKPHVVRTPNDATCLGPFDFIIVSNKILPNTSSIPSLLSPVVSPHTSLVLVQNGISIEQPYSTAFPNNPILSTVTYLPTTRTSPVVVEHKEVEHLHIGTYPSTKVPASHKSAAETLASLIKAGGASATVHDDIQFERWNKLLVNASWNPISALSRSRDAQFFAASSYATEYITSVMREIAAIAQASGYPAVGEDLIRHQISRARARPLPGVELSMLADALAGRAMEVDAIVGNAVKIAEEKGVHVPLLRGLYALLKGLDESFRRDRGEKAAMG